MKKILWLMLLVPLCMQGRDFKVRNAVISYDDTEPYQVVRAIGDLKRDIAMVTENHGDESVCAELAEHSGPVLVQAIRIIFVAEL